jgi:hypothetical protein
VKRGFAQTCSAGAALGNSRPLGTRWHTTPNVTLDSARGHRKEESVQFPVVDGLRELRRGELRKNSLVPICIKFISTAGSSPTITGSSSQPTMHIYTSIKVKRLVCPSYRLKLRSETEFLRRTGHVSNGFIGRARSALPTFTFLPERASDKALALIRWDEKAGPQRDAICSQ